MCSINKDVEQKTTAYRTSTRKEFGIITSIDITPKLIKEFIVAQMYVDAFPTVTEDAEAFNRGMEMWSSRVKPFFEHFEEILNTL